MSFYMAKISRRSLDCLGALVLTVIFHLNQKSLPERELDQRLVGRQPGTGGGSQLGQFLVVYVVALVLCEAKKEHRKTAEATRNQRPITAAAPLALSRHALLEDASAKVRIDEPAPCPLDGLDEACVRDAFTSREFDKQLGFKNSHNASLALRIIALWIINATGII